MTVMRGMMIEQ